MSHNLCAVRLSETFLRYYLIQPTVILPRGSILTGRPIGVRSICAGLCKVFGRGREGCGRRIGMVDVWAIYEYWLICDTDAARHKTSYLDL